MQHQNMLRIFKFNIQNSKKKITSPGVYYRKYGICTINWIGNSRFVHVPESDQAEVLRDHEVGYDVVVDCCVDGRKLGIFHTGTAQARACCDDVVNETA